LGAELRKLATDESAQKAAPETLVDWFEELELENGISKSSRNVSKEKEV